MRAACSRQFHIDCSFTWMAGRFDGASASSFAQPWVLRACRAAHSSQQEAVSILMPSLKVQADSSGRKSNFDGFREIGMPSPSPRLALWLYVSFGLLSGIWVFSDWHSSGAIVPAVFCVGIIGFRFGLKAFCLAALAYFVVIFGSLFAYVYITEHWLISQPKQTATFHFQPSTQ